MVHPSPSKTRRQFLLEAGLATSAVLLPGSSLFAQPKKTAAFKTEHVIFVAFAGGVRSRDTIGTPQNIPNLMRIAKQGVIMPNVYVENLGHYGAQLSLFTGNWEVKGIREYARGENPTIFEYCRKELNWDSQKVWLSTSAGNQQTNFSYSTHKDYGAAYGANLISGDGVFNAEFKEVMDKFGRLQETPPAEDELLGKLRASLDPSLFEGKAEEITNDLQSQREIEKFILDELRQNTTNITGPGAQDAKSIRVALNIFKVFKPKILGISLNNADVAHSSYNAYLEVIRSADRELGALFDMVESDPQLKGKTTLMIMPEFGRDENLNQRNGLDHGERCDDLNKVALIAYGPDFHENKVINTPCQSIDWCPTIATLLGVNPLHSDAKLIRPLFKNA